MLNCLCQKTCKRNRLADLIVKILFTSATHEKQNTLKTARRDRTRPTRGLLILVASLTARQHKRVFLLCHYFATTKQLWENESCYVGRNEMAGLKGKSGPPGNMNALEFPS
jgi:hypothetical protein